MSPKIVSIFIRAGWVMGGVKDRYVKYKFSGDQYFGRCASGIDQNSKKIDFSPPLVELCS